MLVLSVRLIERDCMLLLADTRMDLGTLKAKQRVKGRSLSHAHVSIDRAGTETKSTRNFTYYMMTP